MNGRGGHTTYCVLCEKNDYFHNFKGKKVILLDKRAIKL